MASFITVPLGKENAAGSPAPKMPKALQERVEALSSRFAGKASLDTRREEAEQRRVSALKEKQRKVQLHLEEAEKVRQRKAQMAASSPSAAVSADGRPQSNAEAVREFTMEAGQPTPERPEAMTNDEVKFIGKMILDEVMELFATAYPPAEAKALLKGMIDDSKDIPQEKYEDGQQADKIADQADALVDVYYYSLNAAAKKGVNISSIFDIVHGANMAKRDPATGKFIKRADGKIIKPAGWQSPDVTAEVRRQMEEGSFPAAAPVALEAKGEAKRE